MVKRARRNGINVPARQERAAVAVLYPPRRDVQATPQRPPTVKGTR